MSCFQSEIFEEALQEAKIAGRESDCFVDLWRRPKETVASQGGSGVCASEGKYTHSRTECHRPGLNVTCCNCRGLSKVLVLSEHWLWNFELGKLEQISGEYEATGKADGIGLLR